MKTLLLLLCVIPLILSAGCIYDPNEAVMTPEGNYKWGFDAYTFWYNPHSNTVFEVSYMGEVYTLDPYEIMVGSPETRSVIFKITEYTTNFTEGDGEERPIKLSCSGGPDVDSERVYYPSGTQLRIDMYRGGCWFEPIYWTLE